jgi:restriction system protein
MAKREKINRQAFVSTLLFAPWQIYAVLAIEIFVVMRWIAPALFTSSVLAPISNNLFGYAPVVTVVFLIFAIVSFLLNRKSKNSIVQSGNSTEQADSQKTDDVNLAVTTHSAEWSIDLLRSLDWHRFQMLFAEYFRELGKRVDTINRGADGGIEARIYARDSQTLEYAVQSKALNGIVGIKQICELYGVMAHESAGKGIFVTSGTFSEEAQKFAEEHKDKLFLIDGQRFISMITILPEQKKEKLLAFATEGDYTIPTCALCGTKMIWRENEKFWGCRNYPKCSFILKTANIRANV